MLASRESFRQQDIRLSGETAPLSLGEDFDLAGDLAAHSQELVGLLGIFRCHDWFSEILGFA